MDARKLTRRKTPRLAYSEYVSPDADESSQVWMARNELIEAAKRVFPVFLETLSGKVFPFYEKLAKDGYDLDQVGSYETLSDKGGLKRKLAEWADTFNANRPWVMDGALSTLRGWHVAPDWRRELRWQTFHASSSSGAIGEPFEFSFGPWDPEMFTWPRYSQLLCKKVEEKLSEYEKETRKLAESCGLVRARRTYSQDNFDWFVLYQFAGLSSTKIADRWSRTHDAIDESTAGKGIKAAQKLTAWDRLRTPPGKRNRKIR